mmetsp:Transcript_20797/g.65389  ORF Transcript_20797/g.65389 Transcript_20797/m.65389 type:complete len:200 (+) Transcript_20797:131-730(+)
MQGGIFHDCWSATVTFRGGEWSTGAGGLGGPRGTLVCLCLGGSSGSTCSSTTLTIRCFVASDHPGAPGFGVYRTYRAALVAVPLCSIAACVGRALFIFDSTIAPSAACVFAAASASASALGKANASADPSASLALPRLVYTVFSRFAPCFTIASYLTSPVLASTSSGTTAPACFEVSPFRPISRGYCSKCSSGNAPPSP